MTPRLLYNNPSPYNGVMGWNWEPFEQGPTIVGKRVADRLHLRGNTEPLLTLEGVAQVQSVVLARM